MDLNDYQVHIMMEVSKRPGRSLTDLVLQQDLDHAQELCHMGLLEGRGVAPSLGPEYGVRLFLTDRGEEWVEENLDLRPPENPNGQDD